MPSRPHTICPRCRRARPSGKRCPTCQKRRGGRDQRGYGAEHKRLRADLKPIVEAGEATCWRCGQPIKPDEPWDLGHDDDDRRIWRGPEHANACNRSTAGKRGRSAQ